jgi:hypothetical protein
VFALEGVLLVWPIRWSRYRQASLALRSSSHWKSLVTTAIAQPSNKMSTQYFQPPSALMRSAPLTGRAIQPFRFLDLPAEIRNIIYDLWIPPVLHASLGGRGIRLGYFEEASGAAYFQTLFLCPFFLNRQFYQEFCYALVARSTWSFSSADLLPKVLGRLLPSTRDRIRHISVRLTAHSTNETSTAQRESNNRLAISAFHLAQRHLRHMNQLQTLVIYINLSDFGCRVNTPGTRKRGRDTAIVLAANCVADFTWEGLQTRVPFVESNLTAEFLDTLRRRCGDANVSLVVKGKHHYAGQMVDVVISQCAVMDQGAEEEKVERGGG